jgi:hypothetical protein
MLITLAVISILTIAALVWVANRFLPFTVCPICAGSFLTWAGLLGAHFAGYPVDLIVPAILMGGSVVGIAYQLEKKFNGPSPGARMLWKMFFMTTGFIAAYAILKEQWMAVLFAGIMLVAMSARFAFPRRTEILRGEAIGILEKNMEDCC